MIDQTNETIQSPISTGTGAVISPPRRNEVTIGEINNVASATRPGTLSSAFTVPIEVATVTIVKIMLKKQLLFVVLMVQYIP